MSSPPLNLLGDNHPNQPAGTSSNVLLTGPPRRIELGDSMLDEAIDSDDTETDEDEEEDDDDIVDVEENKMPLPYQASPPRSIPPPHPYHVPPPEAPRSDTNHEPSEKYKDDDDDDLHGSGLAMESVDLVKDEPHSFHHHNTNVEEMPTDMPVVSASAVVCVLCLVVMGALLGATGTALGIYNYLDNDNNSGSSKSASDNNNNNADTDTMSRLEGIRSRGFVNCGTGSVGAPGFLLETGNEDYAGLEYDLCRAIAAALFEGDASAERYRILPQSPTERWNALKDDQVDLLFRTTITMERDVYEPTTQVGYTFGRQPYFWDRLVLGGTSANLPCAEALDFNSTQACQETVICVTEGTTHLQVMQGLVPEDHLRVLTSSSSNSNIFPTLCNVVAGEASIINPSSIHQMGINTNDYVLGTKVFSKEPLSLVTNEGDSRWSDFCQWIVEGLIFAEEQGIGSTNAFRFKDVTAFDKNVTSTATNGATTTSLATYPRMMEHALSIRGNYGDLYNFNVQSFAPREEALVNQINQGDSPIQTAYPLGNYGDVPQVPPELEVRSPTVAAIKKRGFLNCGMNTRKGFAEFDDATQTWSGMDIDLCRALAAALFDGVADGRVVYTNLPAAQRFLVLGQERVDVLSRLTTLTLSRDVREPASGIGMSFSAPYVYDGLTFGGVPPHADCADRLDVVSPKCQSLQVCLLQGTTMLQRVQALLRDDYVSAKLTFEDVIAGLNDGSCNALAGGFHDVAVETIRERGYVGQNYSVGSRRHSKDPLALTTRQDDAAWSDFVKWIFNALVYAEEHNITQATAHQMPRPKLFGPLRTGALYAAVNAVGNYGELYERNFGDLIPRSGMHLLNVDHGPMLYAMPGYSIA